ncbi:MAG: hypothetical protein ACRDJM_11145 [Actinomycetota bacterium]
MKRAIAPALVALAFAAAVPTKALVFEGCVALPRTSCEYVATVPGSILGVGDWLVEIWQGGVCGAGPADSLRSRANGDNNLPGGMAGLLDLMIDEGDCARAWAFGNSVVVVGSVLAPDTSELPEVPDVPSVPPSIEPSGVPSVDPSTVPSVPPSTPAVPSVPPSVDPSSVPTVTPSTLGVSR